MLPVANFRGMNQLSQRCEPLMKRMPRCLAERRRTSEKKAVSHGDGWRGEKHGRLLATHLGTGSSGIQMEQA